MISIFRIRNKNGRYEYYFGKGGIALYDDNSNLPEGYQYEMQNDSQLRLLWDSLDDMDTLMAVYMFETTPPRYNIQLNMVESKLIDDNTIRITSLIRDDKEADYTFITMPIEQYKHIYETYEQLRCKKVPEILLLREGNNFSIQESFLTD